MNVSMRQEVVPPKVPYFKIPSGYRIPGRVGEEEGEEEGERLAGSKVNTHWNSGKGLAWVPTIRRIVGLGPIRG